MPKLSTAVAVLGLVLLGVILDAVWGPDKEKPPAGTMALEADKEPISTREIKRELARVRETARPVMSQEDRKVVAYDRKLSQWMDRKESGMPPTELGHIKYSAGKEIEAQQIAELEETLDKIQHGEFPVTNLESNDAPPSAEKIREKIRRMREEELTIQ